MFDRILSARPGLHTRARRAGDARPSRSRVRRGAVRLGRGVVTLALSSTLVACGSGDTAEMGRDAGEAPAAATRPSGPELIYGGPLDAIHLDSTYRAVYRLAEGVYTYEYARPGDPVTTVSMFVVTDDGVLVADGQGSVEETDRLLMAIHGVTEQPVTHVVIASDHGDHTGGNAAFPDSAELIAHPAAQEALEAARASRDDPEASPVVLADRTVSDRTSLRLGGRTVEVLFLGRGHTAGDLVVYLPDEEIAFMSEAFLDRVFPLLRSGYPSEWVDALRAAEALDAETYVAGHGIRGSLDYGRDNLVRYRQALEQVIAEVRRLHEAGVPVEEAVERADFGALEDQADYGSQAPRAVRRIYLELEGGLAPR